jgi:hypothetical protein
MKVITKSDALALVKKYADAEPEKTVSCYYVKDSQPECIVGNILINDLGADPSRILDFNGDTFDFDNPNRGAGKFIDGKPDHRVVAGLPDVEFTEEAVKVLAAAQSIQDERQGAAGKFAGLPAESYNSLYSKFDATWGDAGRFVQKYFA